MKKKKCVDLNNLPSPFVARCKIEEFTKGLYNGSSMNTFDSRGVGIKNRYTLGTKVFYKAVDVVSWMKARLGD